MIRITGGEWNGRALVTPPEPQARLSARATTRPTVAKLRQALFNSLQTRIPDARVLDLFSGSGALAFEALSRGAAHAVLVEPSRPAIQAIEKNVRALGAGDRVTILKDRIERQLERIVALGPYDVVLADPPYAEGYETKLLQEWFSWPGLLREGGVFCLEWGPKKAGTFELPETVGSLIKYRERDYGDSRLTHYERATVEGGDE